jgi:hypothetical protein
MHENRAILALSIIVAIISGLLIILYLKNKKFNKYSCYNMILLNIILFCDNVIRIVPKSANNENLKRADAFFLVFFDKLLLSTLTSQAIISYIGISHPKIYDAKIKMIFFILFGVGFGISFILTILDLAPEGEWEITETKNYYYCSGSRLKEITDTIYISIGALCTIVCSLFNFINIHQLKSEEDLIPDYKGKYARSLTNLLINLIYFIEQYLLTWDALDGISEETGDYSWLDLMYILTCFTIDCAYNINRIIINEIFLIFCCKKNLIPFDKDNIQMKELGNIIGKTEDYDSLDEDASRRESISSFF